MARGIPGSPPPLPISRIWVFGGGVGRNRLMARLWRVCTSGKCGRLGVEMRFSFFFPLLMELFECMELLVLFGCKVWKVVMEYMVMHG